MTNKLHDLRRRLEEGEIDPGQHCGLLRRGWTRLMFPLMSACALAWFLCRVIPKPIRATYPCQQAAFPLATSCIIWLLALKSGVLAWLDRRQMGARFRPALTVAGLVCLLALGTMAATEAARYLSGTIFAKSWAPADPANSPIGAAKGIFPGRVVWMRDTSATPWNGSTGRWWDDNTGINQAAVDRMMSRSLRVLSGAGTDGEAWNKIFRHYNSTHGRGDLGYRTGERIAIKINCNNTSNYTDTDNHADAAPQSVLAMLRQLVNQAGIPETNITVYEAPNTAPSRVIPNRIFDKCRAEFPNVVYADCTGTGGHTLIQWQSNAITYSVNNGCGRNIPTCVYQADYLINMALLKGHSTAGVTLTAKNHYGTINTREHTFINCDANPMGTYNPFVDLVGHPHLGGKTVLFMIDGLYGVRSVGDTVGTQYGAWNNLFGGQWSASYFMSLDPVAIDSVGVDFLRSEFVNNLGGGANTALNCDNYLHEAALADNPPSGTAYRPDGVNRLGSLGVHEHWNNATDKQYSRNLAPTGTGIELVAVHQLPDLGVTLTEPTNNAAYAYGQPVSLTVTVVTNFGSPARVDFYRGTTLIGSTTNTPFSIAWNNAPVGAWTLSAVVTDTDGLSATSAVVNVSVTSTTNFAPLIIAQPAHQVIMAGETAYFGVEASAWPEPAYQWHKDGVGLAGENAASLWLVNAQSADSGAYHVVVTNTAGAVTSTVAGLAVLLPPTNVSLIPTGALWRYHNLAQDLGTTWRTTNASDLTWSQGYAELGFGDSQNGRPERTTIVSNNQWTTYFRHTFQVDNPAAFVGLEARLLRDDGAVVYLNGTEIFRDNLPGGAIQYNTPAPTYCSDDGTVFYTTNVPLNLLSAGANLIAVEVHQNALNSSDISFDFELVARREVQLPVFLAQPAGQARLEGADVTFTAQAASPTPLSYQWLFNGSPLSSASSPTLQILNLTTNNSGLYRLAASNLVGSVTSAPASLLVMPIPCLGGCSYEDGVFRFQFAGGMDCCVLVSSNLDDWVVLTNLPAGAGTLELNDPTAGDAPVRYYLLRLEP